MPPVTLTDNSEEQKAATDRIQVLNLVGSSMSDFYFNLSVLYARGCVEAIYADKNAKSQFDFVYGLVHPEDNTTEAGSDAGYTWSFPKDLDEATIKAGQRYSKTEGIAKFGSHQPDVVLPHMFCYAGLTHFRALCELLEFEMVGPGSRAQEIAENKAWSKAIFQSAGVPVPPGERLVLGENERPMSVNLSFVVKPCEGNSVGVSLCSVESDVQAALDEAFRYDNEILVEQFIPLGRELRVACIEQSDGSITVLPVLEYFLPQQIRKLHDKLQVAEKGKELKYSPTNTKYPADVGMELMTKLQVFTTKAFKAINSRDYAIFDVRVDPDGNPFFLEASLFCSFAPKSAVVWIASSLVDHHTLFKTMMLNASRRGTLKKNVAKEYSGDQKSRRGKVLICKKE